MALQNLNRIFDQVYCHRSRINIYFNKKICEPNKVINRILAVGYVCQNFITKCLAKLYRGLALSNAGALPAMRDLKCSKTSLES